MGKHMTAYSTTIHTRLYLKLPYRVCPSTQIVLIPRAVIVRWVLSNSPTDYRRWFSYHNGGSFHVMIQFREYTGLQTMNMREGGGRAACLAISERYTYVVDINCLTLQRKNCENSFFKNIIHFADKQSLRFQRKQL